MGTDEFLNSMGSGDRRRSGPRGRWLPVRLAVLISIGMLLPAVFLGRIQYTGTAGEHAALEIAGSVVGLMAGLMLLLRFLAMGNRIHLLIGVAFLINAAEDMAHGLMSHPLIESQFGLGDSSLQRYIPMTYVVGRIMLGLILLVAPRVARSMGRSCHTRSEAIRVTSVALGASLLLTVLMSKVPLPPMMYPDLVISRPVDLISAVILVAAFVQYVKEYAYAHEKLIWWVMLSIGIAASGQVIMSFSKNLYDIWFDVAHLYKFIGYSSIVIGFAVFQIAESKELQHARSSLTQAREEAEAANRAKSAFLANMSHEIRTPMTAILGYAELLTEASEGPDSETRRIEAAQTIKRNGEHLLTVINDILDISKIEANMLSVEHLETEVVPVLEQVVSLLKVRAEGKGLVLEIVFETPIPERIICDPVRLRQIVLNLAGNAIKFTDRGSVLIMCSMTEVGGLPYINIRVKDTGIGMSEEVLERLFKPFSQADDSTTRNYGGSGLGLEISKRLAQMLDGDVTVQSKLGEGSTFTLSLPTGGIKGVAMVSSIVSDPDPDSKEVAKAKTPAADKPLAGLRILLAEDGPDNQKLISFHLKRAGAEVTIANDGVQAIKAINAALREGTDFSIVLMDMQMPNLDGYQATTRLRKRGYSTPIVALTAHTMATDRQKCLDAGCDEHLGKPIDAKQMIACCLDFCQETGFSSAA